MALPDKPIETLFPSRREHMAAGLCCAVLYGSSCDGDGTALEFKDNISRVEYGVTGLCQQCQDNLDMYFDELDREIERTSYDEMEGFGSEDN